MANTVKKLEMPDGTIYELADASVDSKLLNYLPLAGGKMTGSINLNTNHGLMGTTSSGGVFDVFRLEHSTKLQVGGTYPELLLKGKNTRPTYNGNEMALMSDISGNNLCRVYTYESDGSYYLNDNQGNVILTIDGSTLFSGATAQSIMEGFRQDIFEMPETYPNVTPTINYVVRGYFLPAENMHSNLAAALDSVFDFNVTTNIGNVDCFIVEAIGGPKSAAECTLKIEICYKNGTSEKGRIVCSGTSTATGNYTAYNETNTYSGPDIQVVASLPPSPDTNTLYFIK